MSAEMATQIIKFLHKEFGKKFPEAGLELVWSDLIAAADHDLEGAYNYFVLNNRFPSPQQLKDQVLLQAKLAAAKATSEREDEWNKTKGGATREELNRAGSIFTKQQQEAIGRDAVSLLKLIISGTLSKEQIVEQHADLADKHPGSGFAYTAKEQKDLLKVREHWRPLAEAPPRFRLKMGYVEPDGPREVP